MLGTGATACRGAVEFPYSRPVPDLEDALALRAAGEGAWLAFSDPRYESLNGMFGGWTAAIALRGVIGLAPDVGTPSAITISFMDKVPSGVDIVLRVACVGASRSISHWRVDVTTADDERPLAQAMAVLSRRRETDGRTQPAMPTVPDPESLGEFHPPGAQGERTVHRPVIGYPAYNLPDTASIAWVRETTGRRVDRVQLVFLADSYAPRSFYWSDGPRMNATMTMSVFLHATDDEVAAIGDDYILNEAVGTRGASSTSGQQARLWSRHGDLLLTTEQLCWYA